MITWLQHKIGTYIAINTYANHEQYLLFPLVKSCVHRTTTFHTNYSILIVRFNFKIWHNRVVTLGMIEHGYETETLTQTNTRKHRESNHGTSNRKHYSKRRKITPTHLDLVLEYRLLKVESDLT